MPSCYHAVMKAERFEELIFWQKSRKLAQLIYSGFGNNKDFDFRSQICRAVISIPNNIAEGFERKSNKEFKQFLFIAKGSCGEIRSMLYNALDLKYISENTFGECYYLCIEISKLISGFIKAL